MQKHYHFTQAFTAACLGMLLFGIVMISLGSILPELMTKYGLDEIQAGSLASILPFGILAGSLVFGPVVDRYSYRGLLIISALLIFAGLEGIAFAEEIFLLNLALFLIGFGGGAINGGTNALVADISAGRSGSKGANLSFLGVFFGIGALGMPAILGLLVDYFSYERILTGIGLFVLMPALYFSIIRFPRPKQGQGFPVKKWFAMLRDPSLLLLSFYLFFQSGIEGVANNWTTSFLQNQTKADPANALFALSLFVLSMTLTRVLLAGLLRRLRPYLVLAVSLVSALVGSLILMTTSSPVAVTGLVILGVGVAAGFPVILGYLGDLYADVSGTAFSLAFSIALVGNILANYGMGVTAQAYGLVQFPVLLAGCLVVQVLLLGIALRRISGKIVI
jgi:FHS family glucose/mannose:H+ symporter-like MFS transporter